MYRKWGFMQKMGRNYPSRTASALKEISKSIFKQMFGFSSHEVTNYNIV